MPGKTIDGINISWDSYQPMDNCGQVELRNICFGNGWLELSTTERMAICIKFLNWLKQGRGVGGGYTFKGQAIFSDRIRESFNRTHAVIEAAKYMKDSDEHELVCMVSKPVVNPNSGNKIVTCVVNLDGAYHAGKGEWATSTPSIYGDV